MSIYTMLSGQVINIDKLPQGEQKIVAELQTVTAERDATKEEVHTLLDIFGQKSQELVSEYLDSLDSAEGNIRHTTRQIIADMRIRLQQQTSYTGDKAREVWEQHEQIDGPNFYYFTISHENGTHKDAPITANLYPVPNIGAKFEEIGDAFRQNIEKNGTSFVGFYSAFNNEETQNLETYCKEFGSGTLSLFFATFAVAFARGMRSARYKHPILSVEQTKEILLQGMQYMSEEAGDIFMRIRQKYGDKDMFLLFASSARSGFAHGWSGRSKGRI